MVNRVRPRTAAAAFLLCAISAASSQTTVPAAADISGYWELRYDSLNVPDAQLTPAAGMNQAAQLRRGREALAACQNVGMPLMMGDRAPIDIRQSRTVIGIVAKLPSATRYIYVDGRTHPPADELEPSTNGHSTGRWEGGTLVVDTVGFGPAGVTSIPGGGYRTAASRLSERMRVLPGGQRLSVVFTWEDADVFAKPHTYEFRYYRIPDISLPRVYQCNPNDAERRRFLLEPPNAR